MNFIFNKGNSKREFLRKYLLRFIVLSGLVTIFFVAYLGTRSVMMSLRSESERISKEIQFLEGRREALNEEKKIRLVQKDQTLPSRSEVIKKIEEERIQPTSLMNQVVKLVPENVYITGIRVIDGDKMSIDFITFNAIDTMRLVFSLNNAGMYEEIKLPELSIKEGETNNISLNVISKGSKFATE